MKIFVSYCHDDGLSFASRVANILEANGHQAWYFDRNKTPGVLRIVDITQHLRYWYERIIFICTNGSVSSTGQEKEIGQWDRTDKQMIVIPINGAIVPDLIDNYVYTELSEDNFEEEFEIFVKNRLKEITKKFDELNQKKINVKDTVRQTIP